MIHVERWQHKNLQLEVQVPDALPFSCMDVYKHRSELRPDEKLLARANQMPPTTRSQNFELYYFARITVAHSAFYETHKQSEKIFLTINQCVSHVPFQRPNVPRNRSFEQLP